MSYYRTLSLSLSLCVCVPSKNIIFTFYNEYRDRVCRLFLPTLSRYSCLPVLSILVGARIHTGEQIPAKIETRIDETRDFHFLWVIQ